MEAPLIDVVLTSTEKCQSLWRYLQQWNEARVSGTPLQVIVKPFQNTRSLAQNRCMWRLLQRFSDQKPWVVNGETESLSKEEWKAVMTAAYQQESVRLARGLNGGLVLLGQRTSKFGVRKMSEFLEFLFAAAAEYEIKLEASDFEGLHDEDQPKQKRIAA
jgi:hypothetical protein